MTARAPCISVERNRLFAHFLLIPTIIKTIAEGVTLLPGDVIATGTPAGVGIGFKPPRYMVDGDVVRCEIAGIGQLKNRLKQRG